MFYHVDNPAEVERDTHELIDMIDDSLHARDTLASGRMRELGSSRSLPGRRPWCFAKSLNYVEIPVLSNWRERS